MRGGIPTKEFGFEVIHIGINRSSAAEAQKCADLLLELFGFPETELSASIFSSPKIEIMKGKGAGTLGHIAVGTTDVAAAKRYLESKGVEFDESTSGYTEDGKLKVIYLKQEIAGFAFHLLLKD